MKPASPDRQEKPVLTVIDPHVAQADGKFLVSSFLSWLKGENGAAFYGFFGIGPCSFVRRARMKKIHEAFCLALWRLAVESAYPGMGEKLAAEAAGSLAHGQDAAFESAYALLKEALPQSGDEDFSPVSGALCELAGSPPNSILERALALYSRKKYNNFLTML